LANEFLRASFVMSMGSLDAYLHEVVGGNLVRFIKQNIKLINQDESKRARLSRLEKFVKENISPFQFLEIMGRQRPFVQFRKKMEYQIFRKTFQSPEGIENAFGLFGVTDFWPILQNSGIPGSKNVNARNDLEIAYEKRNQIAHEMDRYRSKKKKSKIRPIDRESCLQCIKLVRLIVRYVEFAYWNKDRRTYVF
jgi:hypothetical protein